MGRLGRWLRMLGYDAPWQDFPPVAPAPGEFFITRQRRWAGRKGVVLLVSEQPRRQLIQLIRQLGLRLEEQRLFSRCVECNQLVEDVAREDVEGLVPDFVLATAPGFTRCRACGKVFWPGTHRHRALRMLKEIFEEAHQEC